MTMRVRRRFLIWETCRSRHESLSVIAESDHHQKMDNGIGRALGKIFITSSEMAGTLSEPTYRVPSEAKSLGLLAYVAKGAGNVATF